MNKVLLVGRLTKDVELRTTQNGKSCAQFGVAVTRRFKDANGNYQADFINCVAWGQTAEFINKHFHKGERIGLAGCIQTRTYDDNNGKKVYVVEVLVEEAEFVENKNGGNAPQQKPAPAPSIDDAKDDDIMKDMPFEF